MPNGGKSKRVYTVPKVYLNFSIRHNHPFGIRRKEAKKRKEEGEGCYTLLLGSGFFLKKGLWLG
jgi:hypothetical protein